MIFINTSGELEAMVEMEALVLLVNMGETEILLALTTTQVMDVTEVMGAQVAEEVTVVMAEMQVI